MYAVQGFGNFVKSVAGAAGGAVGGVTRAFRGLLVSPTAPQPDASRAGAVAAAALEPSEAGAAAAAVQLPQNDPLSHLDLGDDVLTLEMALKLRDSSPGLKTISIDGIPVRWDFLRRELELYKQHPLYWNNWVTAVTKIAITEFLEMSLPERFEDEAALNAAFARCTDILVNAKKEGDNLVLDNGTSVLTLHLDKIRSRHTSMKARQADKEKLGAAEATRNRVAIEAHENTKLFNDALTEYLFKLIKKIVNIKNPNHSAETRTKKTLSFLEKQFAFHKIDLPIAIVGSLTLRIQPTTDRFISQIFGNTEDIKYLFLLTGRLSKLTYLYNFPVTDKLITIIDHKEQLRSPNQTKGNELQEKINELQEQLNAQVLEKINQLPNGLRTHLALAEERLQQVAVRPAAAANRVAAAGAAALAPQQ